MPDEDGVGLVQVNVYSEGIRGKLPETTVLMMPEEAESVGAAILEASAHARRAVEQMATGVKS